MVTQPVPADEQLALRTSKGDRDAFAELYDRHFRSVYDLVFRMVREQELAADIAQNTFIRAWENLQKRKVSGNVRAWLLTIARNTAINEIQRKKRWRTIVAPEPEGGSSPAFEVIDTSRLSNPEAAMDDQELVDLVWTSAAALGPKDYSLLDLHLRKDLSAGEMAANLGLSSARVHVMLSRLRDSLEESVSLALLVRRGRRDCAVLSDILDGAARDLTRDTRLDVRHHLKECDLCAESRKRFVAPAEIFSGLALVPVSSQLSADVWGKVAPLLVPGAGSLAVLVTVREWWAHAGVGAKAAVLAGLGVLVVVPVGLTVLVAAGGGAGDTADATGASASGGRSGARVASAGAKSPESGDTDPAGDEEAVAGVVASPEPGSDDGDAAQPGDTPAPGGPPQNNAGAPSPGTPGQATPAPPAPTVTPTPPPAPTPQPTATVPPSNEADLAVISVTLSANPAQPSAGQQFLVSVTALLRNFGGASSALVDTSFSLAAPAGCTVSPSGPVTVQDKTVPLGSDVTITRNWNVTCAAAGDHSFTADASVAIDPSQALTDPNPGNNAGSGAVAVPVAP